MKLIKHIPITSTTVTYRVTDSRYDEWVVNEMIDFVYKAKSEDDAVNNIKVIIKSYEKRLTFWQLLKLMLNK